MWLGRTAHDMSPTVRREVILINECLATLMAIVWALSTMSLFVLGELGLVKKYHVAQASRKLCGFSQM